MRVDGVLAPGVTIVDVYNVISRCVGDAFDIKGDRLNGVVSIAPRYVQHGYGEWRVHIEPHRAAKLATAQIRDGERVLLTFDFGGCPMSDGQVIDLDVIIMGTPP